MAPPLAVWLGEDGDGSTPLDPGEQDGLIPTHCTCRAELNEYEQRGVLEAIAWAFNRQHPKLLTEAFVCRLHKRMFGAVWSWAGTYRATEKNLGVRVWEIRPALRVLHDDLAYWVAHRTFDPDELAVRFHHRLVQVHPFPNGNGRLSRLMADLIVVRLKGARFTWGRQRLSTADARTHYLRALQAADASDIGPLLIFARS